MKINRKANIEIPEGLPKAVGYKIVLIIPKFESTTKTGIIIPDSRLDEEETASTIAYVADIGADAYPTERYKQPWCKVGDWAIIGKWAGVKMQCGDWQVRILNDDNILGVTDKPDMIWRGNDGIFKG